MDLEIYEKKKEFLQEAENVQILYTKQKVTDEEKKEAISRLENAYSKFNLESL